jgi:hypothetical protein
MIKELPAPMMSLIVRPGPPDPGDDVSEVWTDDNDVPYTDDTDEVYTV